MDIDKSTDEGHHDEGHLELYGLDLRQVQLVYMGLFTD